ncbi:hypothetical protein ARMGADRAFT_619273 [Armillaria gallica]|uniref:Uncharacterized protein n=1 Tax=Armillaria gallica TaxID=47427 RepID=A0A2H3CLY6_ARMGA|nr:hypothetical protein ARMGADRAFT_619273 [Armillaria gallica]
MKRQRSYRPASPALLSYIAILALLHLPWRQKGNRHKSLFPFDFYISTGMRFALNKVRRIQADLLACVVSDTGWIAKAIKYNQQVDDLRPPDINIVTVQFNIELASFWITIPPRLKINNRLELYIARSFRQSS